MSIIDDSEAADDCDIYIDCHHNQKKDAPSETALMTKNALIDANNTINIDKVSICSIREGNIFGEHEMIFVTHSEDKE